ncbi:MAG: hypothetical protein ACREUY_06045, partial [Burkholderiales bacterium]
TVYGKLMPAQESLSLSGLPIGLAQGVKLKKAIAMGTPLTWSDVIIDKDSPVIRFRLEMEKLYRKEWGLQPHLRVRSD